MNVLAIGIKFRIVGEKNMHSSSGWAVRRRTFLLDHCAVETLDVETRKFQARKIKIGIMKARIIFIGLNTRFYT